MVFDKIYTEATLLDVDFHPSKPLILAADIDGPVHIYPLENKTGSASSHSSVVTTFRHHSKSCRRACFSEDGNRLFSISKDKSLQVVELNEGKIQHNISDHEKSLYSMLVISDFLVATGDEAGTLKLWDLRLKKCIMERTDCEEFISDMIIDDSKKILVATSGDGTVSAFDCRKHKLAMQSELFDAELLSLTKVKNGNKLCVGSGEGVIYLFNWGEWGNMSDRFPGHPDAIDSMLAVSDDVVITGNADGKLRVVSLLPNRIVSELGSHGEFPVESLSLSPDRSQIASCSHDNYIRFWPLADAVEQAEDIDPQSKPERSEKRRTGKGKAAKPRPGAAADFFDALVADESDEDE